MRRFIVSWCMVFVCAGWLSAQEQTVLQLDFEKPLDRSWYVNGAYNSAKGYAGKGVLFAQENLSDFAEVCPDVAPSGAIQRAFQDFPFDCGYLEVRFLPYFNQNRAYPRNPNNKLILYYLMQGSPKDGQPASLAIYHGGEVICANFKVEGSNKEYSIGLPISKSEKGKWQTLRFAWTPEEKTLTLNGKSRSLEVAGKLKPIKHFKLGGIGNNLSLQAVVDDLKIVKTQPKAKETGLTFNFTTPNALAQEWELVKLNGAEGHIELDNTIKSVAGTPSLKFVKTNAKGYLVLKHKSPIVGLSPDGGYRLSGRYHSTNAQPDNYLLLRMPAAKWDPLLYDARPNSSWVYPVYTYVRHTVSGQWADNFYYFLNGGNATGRNICVVLGGSACTVNLENFAITPVKNLRTDPYPEYGRKFLPLRVEDKFVFSEEEMLAHVRKRTPAEIKAVQDGRSLRFMLNGKQEVPAIYFVQAGNFRAHYYEMNKDAGVQIFLLHCVVGGSSKYNVLKPNGTYDFSKCEAEILSALRRAPDSTLILKLTVGAYPGLDDTPDEIWQNREGLLGVSNTGNMLYCDTFVKERSNKQQYYPSYASAKWMSTCGDAAEAFINRLKELGVFNAFAGIQLSIGEDGQFLTWYHKQDFSPAARKGFGKYLQKKYGTVENLRVAWRNSKASFEFATRESMPAFDIKTASRFLDPAVDMPLIDAMMYHNDMQLEVYDYFVKRMQQAAGRKLYVIGMAPGSILKSWVEQVATSKTPLTAFRDCMPYVERRPGRATANTAAYDSARDHGIVCFNELDIRTYAPSNPATLSTFAAEWSGTAYNPADFQTILRKLIAPQVAKGMGFWYYDMNQYFAQEPKLHQVMKKTQEIAKEVVLKKDTFVPDVAVILDHNSIFYHVGGFPVGNLQPRINQMNAYYLAASGVPFDLYYLSDLLANPEKLKPYKTIIFTSTIMLNDADRKIINQFKNSNRTLIWLYPAGLMDGNTPLSTEKASQLMGIKIADDGNGSLTMTSDGKLCLGFDDFLRNRCYPHVSGVHRYRVADTKAELLGRFLENDAPGMAQRKFADWTSIYVGSPDGLSDAMLNRIAKENGSFVAVDKPGAVLAMRNNFVSLHVLRSGDYVVKFPQKGNIIDTDSGKVLAKNSDTLPLHLNVGETKWLIQR